MVAYGLRKKCSSREAHMSHINWPTLFAHDDETLRNAILASMSIEATREWFATQYPHLFLPDSADRAPIPLSYLLQRFEAYRKKDETMRRRNPKRELATGLACAWAGFPELEPPIASRYDAQLSASHKELDNASIRLTGVIHQWPMILSDNGKEYVVVQLDFVGYEPKLGTRLTENRLLDHLDFLELVETKYIDFNS